MRKLLCFLECIFLCAGCIVYTVPAALTNEELNLNARAAVLMDADSGRVLYGKNEETAYPMASTTKVMTLIVALENADPEQIVRASAYAASMPEVHLGVREGEQYRMGDLYYALMLESFNDAAVMIAEGIAGSVAEFADMMNEKALQLGCENTYFITPNGLDASDAAGVHSSTAKDMALIMRYAIKNADFLKITQTRCYSFSDTDNQRCFLLNNKNTLFDRMEGAVSGKTGYTADAGYCYVCAVQKGEKCFVAALLGSGWPPNKNYKWQDVQTLIAYGDDNYNYHTLQLHHYLQDSQIHVTGGEKDSVMLRPCEDNFRILMKEGETLRIISIFPGQIAAPIEKGMKNGIFSIELDGCSVGGGCYAAVENVLEKRHFLDIFD